MTAPDTEHADPLRRPGTRVLVVLPDPPLPEGGAAGRCAVGLLRGLREHGVDVSALAARSDYAPPGEPPGSLPVQLIDVSRAGRWRARADLLLRPCGSLSRGSFGERVRALGEGADVVHLDQVDTSWCDVDLATPSLVTIHYLVRRDRSLRTRAHDQLAALLVRRLAERAAVRRHRWLVANSPRVASELRRLAPRADVLVVPLTLDPDHYCSASLAGPPTVGFIGTASWQPTAASLRRLVTRIWPLVRRQVPSARLQIAGRGMSQLGLDERDGVEVLGEVPSAAGFLQGISVLVHPLERGSGMKVKVLEALASGVPVVTTDAGAEGLEPGAGIVVEAEDERIATAAVAILRDDIERKQRGAAARRTFLDRYAPGVAVEPLVPLYERMAGLR